MTASSRFLRLRPKSVVRTDRCDGHRYRHVLERDLPSIAQVAEPEKPEGAHDGPQTLAGPFMNDTIVLLRGSATGSSSWGPYARVPAQLRSISPATRAVRIAEASCRSFATGLI